ACVGNELLCFHSLNEVALQAVGGAMRQTGDLPDWLMASADPAVAATLVWST
ncbi:hypothetical protein H7J92_02355, partial [Sporosarcina aquimarina]|nr:hypothetical protein [Sporosarcina aquimarina]